MTTLDILNAIQNSTVARAISKSDHLVAAGLQVVHVLSFVVLLAALVLISLRVLGLALNRQTAPQIAREVSRLVWPSFVLTVVSGTLMFVATPKLYYDNPAFELKMLLLLLAAILHVALFKRIATSESPNRTAARASVAVSLAAWFSVALAGRMIGFI
jgi:hypothetical protein